MLLPVRAGVVSVRDLPPVPAGPGDRVTVEFAGRGRVAASFTWAERPGRSEGDGLSLFRL